MLLFFVVLSVFVSPNPSLSFYQALKLVEFIAVFLAIIFYRENIFEGNFLISAFLASVFVQSLLGIVQFFTKKSIGLRFLGESILGIQIGGSSTFWAGSEKYLRAYGTTSHPNILAAFMFMSLVLLAYLFFKQINKKKY